METTGGYFYHPGRKFSRFEAIEFLSQITYARTRIRNVHTYIIGERAKRARHSQVCSIENRGYVTGSGKREKGHIRANNDFSV